MKKLESTRFTTYEGDIGQILSTPEHKRDWNWLIETYPVDDDGNRIFDQGFTKAPDLNNNAEGFDKKPNIDLNKEGFEAFDKDFIHLIFEFKVDGKKFQEHHIISDKNKLTKDHKLLKELGYDLQSRGNKIYLPTREEYHPTRSIHLGKHDEKIMEALSNQMDRIYNQIKMEKISIDQADNALKKAIIEERFKLRKGERALNKHKRKWSDNSDIGGD